MNAKSRGFLAALFLVFGLAVPAWANGLDVGKVGLTLGGDAAAKNAQDMQIVAVRPDGTEVPVKDYDGKGIEINMGNPGASEKPKTDANPAGGRVDAEPGKVDVTLPAGYYKIKIKDRTSGETYDTGTFVVHKDGTTKIKIDASSKIVLVKPKDRPPTELGAVQPSGVAPMSDFAINLGAEFGTGSASLKAFGDEFEGQSTSNQASLNFDYRYHPNGANIANIANLGNVGNVANLGPGIFFGAWLGAALAGRQTLLSENLHPGGDGDTTIGYRQFVTMGAYMGYPLATLANGMRVNGLAGVQGAISETKFKTDESGGGGVQNEDSQVNLRLGPMVGWELEGGPPANLPNIAGRIAAWRLALMLGYLPGSQFDFESETLNNQYEVETEGSFFVGLRFGLAFGLGGLANLGRVEASAE